MKQKIFELIDGREVCLAYGVDRIPSADITAAMDSQELLAAVHRDVLEYRKQIVAEGEAHKEKAELEGFCAGYDTFLAHVGLLEKEIASVRGDMHNMLMPLAMAIAKKIVMAELTTRPEVIMDMIVSTVKSVAQHKRVVIYVSDVDFARVEQGKGLLKPLFESLESFSVRSREDIAAGEFVIETEIGIINARMQDRWNTLESALQATAHAIIQEKDAP